MIKRLLTGIGVIGSIWLAAGCAEIVVPGTIAGGGEYYRYNTGNVAKRTFVSNVSRLTEATRKALENMGIQYDSTSIVDSETEMKASTGDLDITITMQPVNATTTKLSVNAATKTVFKDRATAAEIIHQIDLALNRNSAPDTAPPKVSVKNNCHRTIDIVVYYLSADNGPASWQTRGWFGVAPGQKKHVADTLNRYVYFYGETRSKNKMVWTGEYPQWFEGKHYDFFKVDMGTRLMDYTYSFNCD